jgi:hypothetical protein
MTSVKCPQCGLVYWSTAEACKRCGQLTANTSTGQPESYAQPAPAGNSGRQSQVSDADSERLLNTLKKDAHLFYFIGGIQTLAWFFIGQLLIVDAFFNIGLSYLTHKFRSRVAAILLMLLTLLSVGVTLLSMLLTGAGFNFFIPLILVWRLGCSIRMVYTTFKLNSFEEVDVTRMMPPLPPVFQRDDASQWDQPMGSPQLQPE